jgi:hypothetical protein
MVRDDILLCVTDSDDSEDSYESSFIDDDDSYESSDEYNPDDDTDEDWE